MNGIRVANAPCSWGRLEFEGLEGEWIGYQQMLDELVETGYTGTELGDWGFMPTDPTALRTELERRHLTLLGAFVPVALKDGEAHARGEAQALKVARLLAAVAGADNPFIVLADDNGGDPIRTKHAGRVTAELGLDEAGWRVFTQGAEQIARAVRDETGLRTVFHHHCAGYVETPEEIARFLEMTDPTLLGLVFDTGHYTYGAGLGNDRPVRKGLDRFADRIWYVHFKDCHGGVAARARAEGWDYFEAVRHGVFCELGQGQVDFPAVVAWLRDHGYRGWIVVEQDVLPGMGTPKESAWRNREYLASIGLG
ncbi:MAG: TIM barrel protein [Ardenticatenaceae bacterium]|nr:TIM barrel protein [Ardenticatenaceae bacterium]